MPTEEKVTQIHNLCKGYARNALGRITACDGKGSRILLSAYRLLTDGQRLYVETVSPYGIPSGCIDITDGWAFDRSSGELVYGTITEDTLREEMEEVRENTLAASVIYSLDISKPTPSLTERLEEIERTFDLIKATDTDALTIEKIRKLVDELPREEPAGSVLCTDMPVETTKANEPVDIREEKVETLRNNYPNPLDHLDGEVAVLVDVKRRDGGVGCESTTFVVKTAYHNRTFRIEARSDMPINEFTDLVRNKMEDSLSYDYTSDKQWADYVAHVDEKWRDYKTITCTDTAYIQELRHCIDARVKSVIIKSCAASRY